MNISVRGGGPGGGVAPQLWRNFEISASFGQIFVLGQAKMLANNGLCVGHSPPDFSFLYAYEGESECLFPEDLWRRERTYLAFGTHFGAERGLKTMSHSMFHCIKQ